MNEDKVGAEVGSACALGLAPTGPFWIGREISDHFK